MNWNEKRHETDITLERIRQLEKRIKVLEASIARHRDRFLEEDLKARGLE